MRHYEKFYLIAFPAPPAPVNSTEVEAVSAPPSPTGLALAVVGKDNDVRIADLSNHHLRDTQLLWEFVPLVGEGNSYKGVAIRNLDCQLFLRYHHSGVETPDGKPVTLSGIAEDRCGWHIGPARESTPERTYFRITDAHERVTRQDYDLTIAGGGPWSGGADVITWLWREQPNQLWGILPYLGATPSAVDASAEHPPTG